MTPTGELFLGIIAFAVMIMALVQVGAIMAGFRLAKRVDQIARQLDEDIKPLLANLTAMSAEAARAAALAADAEINDDLIGTGLRLPDDRVVPHELGWKPAYDDFESGLAATIQWYQAHESWWRPAKEQTEASYAARGQA